ncbi:MAG TPA: GNAT family N-acetyltransferase [Egibacteraceae bacterium]|jgi:DNA-binding transcriptional MerR regulator|nr:GNAT family N-acetyltransferase [Egibacteraceae bacterium]
MDELLPIGEFSQRCGLSAKVLRSYAEQGILSPVSVDASSGYRYYDPSQLEQAKVVRLLRRAGVSLADIGPFLEAPSADTLDGWERSLAAEVIFRRQALAETRARLGLTTANTKGATVIDIRPLEDLAELERVASTLGAERRHLDDLEARFEADRPLMVIATAGEELVGTALAFRHDATAATLRIAAVAPRFRHRGVGRRLVERVEAEARRIGVERMSLGTDEEVGFWSHLGYVAHLLFQWVYDADLLEQEEASVLAGPLAGFRHWRSSFADVPQLFVELDEPRLDLVDEVRDLVSGCHVGFMMTKQL